MLGVLALLAIIATISAHYSNYGYGYDNYNFGFKKHNIDYNPRPYIPHVYGQYGRHYDYPMPYHKNFYPYRRTLIIKRLPPIIKNVKQHVYVEQPVIINKIPVIHKKKQVVIKKQPPIYDVNQNPTVIEKDLGVGVIPEETKDVIPKDVVTDQKNVDKDIGFDVEKALEGPKVTKEVYDEKPVFDDKDVDETEVKPEESPDLDKRIKGSDPKDVEIMKDVKDMQIMKELDVMKSVKDVQINKEMNVMENIKPVKDEDNTEYNNKDFEAAKLILNA